MKEGGYFYTETLFCLAPSRWQSCATHEIVGSQSITVRNSLIHYLYQNIDIIEALRLKSS